MIWNGLELPPAYYQDDSVYIIHGDCREILPLIPDKSIDLLLTDPPYNTTKEQWDKEDVVSKELVEMFWNAAKLTSNLYLWCGIGEGSQSLIRWFPIVASIWHFKDLITWKKSRGYGMRRGWLITREEIMWFVKDNSQFIWNEKLQYSNEKRTFTATYSDKERLQKYLN